MTCCQASRPPASTMRRRLAVAVPRGQRLPLERQQAVPLQIAECAVVGEDVESIRGALERAAGPMAAVAALADVRAQHARAVVGRHPPGDRHQLIVGQRGRRVERGRDDLDLAVRIEVAQA